MKAKKTPADYPQFSFRISKEDKKRINDLVADLVESANKSLPEESKLFRNNDVIVDALYLGLLTLKKKGMRLAKF